MKTPPGRPKAAKRKPVRKPADPAKQWASYLRRYRPGLPRYVLDQLTATYGEQRWEARLDPTSELILTILTQNTADVNAEHAFDQLRAAYPSASGDHTHQAAKGSVVSRPGWGGRGWPAWTPRSRKRT